MIANLILSCVALFAVLGTVLALCTSKKSSASVTVLQTSTSNKSQRSGSNQSRKSNHKVVKSKVQPSGSGRAKSPQYITLKVKSLSMLPVNNASAMLMGKTSKKINTILQPKPERVWSNQTKLTSSSQNLFTSFQQSQLSRKKMVSETEMPKSDFLNESVVSSIKSSGSGYYATLMKQMKVKSVSQYITTANGQPQY